MPVQITDVDGVHVDDMNIFESSQGEIGEDLTSKTPCTDYEDLALIAEEIFDLDERKRVRRCSQCMG